MNAFPAHHLPPRPRSLAPAAGQRGGFVIGLVVGLLIGLAAALGVALYVTKAPIPFVNKVPARPPGQDAADAERDRNWNPNSGLAGKNPMTPASAAPEPTGRTVTTVTATGAPPAEPASASTTAPPRQASASGAAVTAALTPGAPATRLPTTPETVLPTAAGDPFTYFVQAGAFSRTEDAEQQRARLGMLGVESRVTEREQGGRTVYRVRVGPFDRKVAADGAKQKLADAGVDSALVRVQK